METIIFRIQGLNRFSGDSYGLTYGYVGVYKGMENIDIT